jgi:hypothetical protein
LKDWQFDVLFFVAVGGAIFLLFAPEVGVDTASNPTAVTGIGAILTYVLTQRRRWTEDKKKTKEDKKEEVLSGSSKSNTKEKDSEESE